MGVVLRHAVRAGSGVSRDALRAGDVYKRVVAGLVSFLGGFVNGLELFGGIDKALVTPRNVVIHLDTEYIRRSSAADDLVGVTQAQAVAGDADVVRPVLADLAVKRCQQNEEPGGGSKSSHWQITECAPPQVGSPQKSRTRSAPRSASGAHGNRSPGWSPGRSHPNRTGRRRDRSACD